MKVSPTGKPAVAAKKVQERKLKIQGWKTSDDEEIALRKLRASTEPLKVESLEPNIKFYGTYRVQSQTSRRIYLVEIRSLTGFENSCECPDFRGNGLGTCKHIEGVLAGLSKGQSRAFHEAASTGSPKVEIYLSRRDRPEVKVAWPSRNGDSVRKILEPFFSYSGALLGDPATAISAIERELSRSTRRIQQQVRIARDVRSWAAEMKRAHDCTEARRTFIQDLRDGKRSLDFLKHPLYPYQQEGMLHLAFGEHAMLADDMGLGKTVQAVAACELLKSLRKIEHVLIICPASLKVEWEEQITKFSHSPLRIVTGLRQERLNAYRQPAFYYITNYEQIRNDLDDISAILAPDVVILDEAQRIKNWQTKTAKSVKQLVSPYAFVLTGTPLENRIDEIYSIIEFLNHEIFGPLFRFNREFYELDDRGRPTGYRNLDELHRRVHPIMLRRRKSEVEEQLPARTVNTYFVSMETEQRARYEEYSMLVARLLAIAKRRPLLKQEAEKLQKFLACMRMLCDTPYILDSDCRVCPKLEELESILDEVLAEEQTKVIVFSEWERMLMLVRDLVGEMKTNFAWHTGSVPQKARREEIIRFKNNPECRLFLSTDSGSTGLNLQAANVVINLDLPWNPAKLEQRIARAWRKHQTRSVSVIHLVSENSIEHRMLSTLAQKQQLADSVIDGIGDMKFMAMPSGRAAMIDRLEALMGSAAEERPAVSVSRVTPARPAAAPHELFKDDLAARIDNRLLLMESRKDAKGRETILVVVEGNAEQVRPVATNLLNRSFSSEEGKSVSLELVDRPTFATIQRLIDSGVLHFNPQGVRQIYRSSAFADIVTPAVRQRRIVEAQEILLKAERKMQMSLVLKKGGFPIEALPPLNEAVEVMLKAIAHINDDPIEQTDKPSLHQIETRLVCNGLLPAEALSFVARVRDATTQSDGISPQLASQLVGDAEQVFKYAREAMNKAAIS